MKQSTKIFLAAVCATGLVTFAIRAASAETTDFGGYSDRFKGAGDKIPPRCQIDVPTASTTPFFVKWNCSDDNADPSEIRTELWLYRNGSPAGELVANFLGFPASVQIDEGLLGVTNFTAGLPLSVKLLARDRAGITAISPSFVVRAQDNTVSSCSLTIQTEATESTGSTTGSPSSTVHVSSANVTVTQPSDTQVAVAAAGSLLGDPCDINSICFDNSRLTFTSSLTFSSSDSTANGTVSVVPGSLVVSVSGSTASEGVMLTSFDVSGATKIDGVDATLTLKCDR